MKLISVYFQIEFVIFWFLDGIILMLGAYQVVQS